MMDINYTGTFLCAQGFAREYIARHPGEAPSASNPRNGENEDGIPGVEPATALAAEGAASIVMVGSMSARVANFKVDCTAYNPSKAAVCQLARSLAQEWGIKGIRVNVRSLSPLSHLPQITADML